MSLTVEQSAEHQSGRRWKWAVWLAGLEHELDNIDRVTYLLHPTFPDPVKQVRDRASSFRLDATGWGEFLIRAQVRHHNGDETTLRHELRLVEHDEHADRKQPVVFLSYSSADASAAQELQEGLADSGIIIRDAGDIAEPGGLWEDQLSQAVRGSDAVIAVKSESTSPWVDREVSLAESMGVPIVPVTVGHPDVFGASDTVAIELDPGNVSRSTESIARSVVQAFERGRS